MSDTSRARQILTTATKAQASDIFIIAGLPLTYKVNGIMHSEGERLMPNDTLELIQEIYTLAEDRKTEHLTECGDDDFSFAIPGMSRYRASAYKQRGSYAAVIRTIAFELPNPELLHIPQVVLDQAKATTGIILITGKAGSGKSTTLACLVDRINSTRENHIITLEDPLEFLHRHKKSIVSQREIASDTDNYLTALRAALRQSPDVILLGEMRDHETIQTAMTAAETGHLVLSSLHTIGAASSISRIIDVFEPSQQRQIAVQLSMVLRAVISQQLVPAVDGTIIPAFEVMVMTPAISNMIRNGNVHQIGKIYSFAAKDDMISMDSSLYQLYCSGTITKETAIHYSNNQRMMEQKLGL